jgi:putative metallohydrolase (TIGR04338 family)
MSRRPRDNQRQKVYDSEHSAFGLRSNHTTLTIAECQALVARIYASPWTKKTFGDAAYFVPQVVASRGGGRARGAGTSWPMIELGVYGRCRWVVIHEVAHHLVSRYVAAHGWEFCEAYLKLVSHFIGTDAAKRLKTEFKAHRVKYTRPRPKRPISDEQRAVLAARLATARAAKVGRAHPDLV